MIKALKKILRFLLKTILIFIVGLVLLDVVTSVIRYTKYYSQTDVKHPMLNTEHNDYVVNFPNNSNHKMNEFKEKVKLIYWHSGCPSSSSWFPEIEKIAKQYSDSLVIFFITNQSNQSLTFFTKLDLTNFNFCKGNGRTKEKRFKHHHSSHLVILDKNNILRAYGYQLSQTDSLIKRLVQNQDIPKSLQDELLFEENILQDGLKNINNLNFQVTNYNENFQSRATWSTNMIDCKNLSIQSIYSIAFKIPNYRIINLSNRVLNGKNNSEKYCIYYKTKTPFAPFIWQMFFDNRAKRAKVFTDDLQERIDKEFGLKSIVKKKKATTLVLKDIKPNDKNSFKRLPRRSEYKHDISTDSDSTKTIYSYKTNLSTIITEIEQRIEKPVVTDNIEKGKYQLDFSILDKKEYTLEEIIKDLENQGFVFSKEERMIEYLEIEKAADNILYK